MYYAFSNIFSIEMLKLFVVISILKFFLRSCGILWQVCWKIDKTCIKIVHKRRGRLQPPKSGLSNFFFNGFNFLFISEIFSVRTAAEELLIEEFNEEQNIHYTFCALLIQLWRDISFVLPISSRAGHKWQWRVEIWKIAQITQKHVMYFSFFWPNFHSTPSCDCLFLTADFHEMVKVMLSSHT